MVSQTIFALRVSAFALVSAALASEAVGNKCLLQQDGTCMAQQDDVILLQVTSHYAAIHEQRDMSQMDKAALQVEAQMAFAEIGEQLLAHPKVAKQALHEALIAVKQSSEVGLTSWPFATGANQLSSADAMAAKPGAMATAVDMGHHVAKANLEGPPKTHDMMKPSSVVAVQQQSTMHQQPTQQSTPETKPLGALEQPADGAANAAQPAGNAAEQLAQAGPEGARISPFGKEDTAEELTQHAVATQDTLVDAVENAEVAEVKRAVFRSLTRLRAASIKEFDTIARLETQAFDEYNDAHHYRAENPLEYIHSAEPKVKEDKFTSFH